MNVTYKNLEHAKVRINEFGNVFFNATKPGEYILTFEFVNNRGRHITKKHKITVREGNYKIIKEWKTPIDANTRKPGAWFYSRPTIDKNKKAGEFQESAVSSVLVDALAVYIKVHWVRIKWRGKDVWIKHNETDLDSVDKLLKYVDFGSGEYYKDLDARVEHFHPIIVDNYVKDRVTPPPIQTTYIKFMMEDVNSMKDPKVVPFEVWDEFCNFFNKNVLAVNDEKLHYFRNRLNRTPKTLSEMFDIKNKGKWFYKDNWTLLPPEKSVYHMYDTVACNNQGEFNLKFVSNCGKHEAVFNRAGVLLDERKDPVNMGTYNYACPNREPIKHFNLDVVPYSDETIVSLGGTVTMGFGRRGRGWGNVKGVHIDFSHKDNNLDKYKNNQAAVDAHRQKYGG